MEATSTDTDRATITLTETDTPSRSKGSGWLRLHDASGTFASRTGRTVTKKVGAEFAVQIGVKLRRASGRQDKESRVVTLVATGDPADTVDLSIGSPQSYDARITGARRLESDDA